jgi:hypothetical protein
METLIKLDPKIAAEAAELSDALMELNIKHNELRDKSEAAHKEMWAKIDEDPTIDIVNKQYHYNYEDHSITHIEEDEVTVASFLMEVPETIQ